MKTNIQMIALILTLAFCGCRKDTVEGPKDPRPVNLTEKAQVIIDKSNVFGIDLFRETAQAQNGNLMLSPLSASTALSMLLNGCQAETYNQIRDMLGYGALTQDEINESYQSLVSQLLILDPEINLSLANSVWYRQGFAVKSPFLTSMENAYDAEIAALDFASPSAITTINNWAKENTNGKIEQVLQEIDPAAVMFLMNALYFKGTWTYQFDKSQTGEVDFHPDNSAAVQVDMMKGKLPCRLFAGNNYTAIELNYGQQNFAMDIVVPFGTLDEFLSGFNGEAWQEITTGLNAVSTPESAELIIPKFKFDFEKVLNDQLTALGMIDAFECSLANLSGISDDDIYVSFVKQNTFVDVNEEGTEAAAVTTIGIVETSAPLPFVVDKPFIFAIRERLSNTLLFIGKVELPVY